MSSPPGELVIQRRTRDAKGFRKFGGTEGPMEVVVNVDERCADFRIGMGKRVRRAPFESLPGADHGHGRILMRTRRSS